MTDSNPNPPPSPGPPSGEEPPGKAEYLALGLGCLVTVIFFAAVLYFAAVRGG